MTEHCLFLVISRWETISNEPYIWSFLIKKDKKRNLVSTIFWVKPRGGVTSHFDKNDDLMTASVVIVTERVSLAVLYV